MSTDIRKDLNFIAKVALSAKSGVTGSMHHCPYCLERGRREAGYSQELQDSKNAIKEHLCSLCFVFVSFDIQLLPFHFLLYVCLY